MKTKLYIIPFTVETPQQHELIAIVEAVNKKVAEELVAKPSIDAIRDIIDSGRSDIHYGDVKEIVKSGKDKIILIEEIK